MSRLPAPVPGLIHVSDGVPGISRRRRSAGFIYVGPDGSRVRDETTLARIRRLAIPPAYRDVWICPLPEGHIQAVGRDARGRKQYRYHADWRSVRDAEKYGHLLGFGAALPRIRRQVADSLSKPGVSRERVLAACIHLLDVALVRVGNVEYARANGSFGLTTMRNRHLHLDGTAMRFTFRGKHHIEHRIEVRNRRLANLLRRCRELPGQHLFEYLDAAGTVHAIRSDDVNDHLRAIARTEVSAKDFRTWAGSRLALEALLAMPQEATEAARKAQIVATVRLVAARLGNTPAICRKCYIHPAVLDAHLAGELAVHLGRPRADALLEPAEQALMRLLRAVGTQRPR